MCCEEMIAGQWDGRQNLKLEGCKAGSTVSDAGE